MVQRRQRRQDSVSREKSEFDQKVLDIRRTARVVAGGRRFSFRAAVVVGDRKGSVGFGIGKGPDVATAIKKAVFQAWKKPVLIPLTKEGSILHTVDGKVGAARVVLKPAREGRGIVAGGPIRAIADIGGLLNLTAKILGRTSNTLNNARATMEALRKLKAKNF